MSEDQERRRNELSKSEIGDVEGHAFRLGNAEEGDAETERREDEEPDVEGHAFEIGRNEHSRSELSKNELGRSETP